MSKKDDIISIGFDYREQLAKACNEIEDSINKAASSTRMSKELKKELNDFKKSLSDLKSNITDAFKDITKGKIDTDKFNTFRTRVNKELERVDAEINGLNNSVEALNNLLGVSGKSIDLSNIINQFKELQDYINKNHESVLTLMSSIKNSNASFELNPSDDKVKKIKETIDDLKKSLNVLTGDNKLSQYGNENIEQLSKDLTEAVNSFKNIRKEYSTINKEIKNTDKSSETFKDLSLQATLLNTKLLETATRIQKIQDTIAGRGIDNYERNMNNDNFDVIDVDAIISKIVPDSISDKVEELLETKLRNGIQRAQQTVSDLYDQLPTQISSSIGDIGGTTVGTNKLGIQVHVATKNSTLWKELKEKVDILQGKLNTQPAVLPVKLVLSPIPTKGKDSLSTSEEYIKNVVKELNETGEGAVVDIKGVYKKTVKQALIEAENAAKESLERIQEIFDKHILNIHLNVPDEEIQKVSNVILNDGADKKLDLSGQVEKTNKKVKELVTLLTDADEKIKKTKDDNRFKGLSDEIQNALSQLTDLKNILSSIRDLEDLISRATNTATNKDLSNQWNQIKFWFDYISNDSGDINLNKQKKQISTLMSMYKQYVDMGGNNPLRDLSDNEKVVAKLYNQFEKLKKVESIDQSSSIQNESKSFKNVEDSVDSLISKIGDTKVEAINREVITMEDASQKEIDSIQGIIAELDKLVTKLNDIKNIKIPNISIADISSKKKKVKNKTNFINTSVDSLSNENHELMEIDSNAQKASISKEKFAKANKDVAQTAKDSSKIIASEVLEMNKISTISLDKSSDEWESAAKSAHMYFEELDDIVSITKNVGTYTNKNGDTALNISYRVTDIKGSSRTFNPSGDLLGAKDTISIEQPYKDLEKSLESIYKIQKKIIEGNYISKDLSDLVKIYADIEKSESDILELKNHGFVLSEKESEIERQRVEYNKNIKDLIYSEVKDWQTIYNKLDTRPDNSRSSHYNELLNSLSDINNQMVIIANQELITQDDIDKFIELKMNAEGLNEQFKFMTSADKGASELSRSKLIEKINQYLQDNTRLSKENRAEFELLITQLKSLGADANVANLTNEFLGLKNRVREANQEGKSFLDTIKDKAWYGFAAQIGTYFSFRDIINYIKKAISTIKELDTALVDLKKTTSMTGNELEQFYYDSNKVAKQMGVTTKEIIEQSSAWSRLGFSTKEASTQMAQLSSQFASISPGMDTDQAQSGLVSIMKAWGISTEDAEREIMDNINTLGNKFAETNLDIVEGMQRSAAAMAAIGEDWRSSFAIFTGGQEIVQNAEKMGTAMRSFSLRIRGYSENSEDDALELDEDLKTITGDLVDLTKTAEHAEGISVFKEGSTTEFKSLVEYLGEVSDIWDEMSQVQQTQFLQKAFAKTQAQAGAAIIQNFDQVRKALEEMENAAGSSDREMSIIQESIDYKLNSLSQTWVGTFQKLIDRGDIGKLIDLLTKLSEAIGSVVGALGVGGTLGVGIGAYAGIKNFGTPNSHIGVKFNQSYLNSRRSHIILMVTYVFDVAEWRYTTI